MTEEKVSLADVAARCRAEQEKLESLTVDFETVLHFLPLVFDKDVYGKRYYAERVPVAAAALMRLLCWWKGGK